MARCQGCAYAHHGRAQMAALSDNIPAYQRPKELRDFPPLEEAAAADQAPRRRRRFTDREGIEAALDARAQFAEARERERERERAQADALARVEEERAARRAEAERARAEAEELIARKRAALRDAYTVKQERVWPFVEKNLEGRVDADTKGDIVARMMDERGPLHAAAVRGGMRTQEINGHVLAGEMCAAMRGIVHKVLWAPALGGLQEYKRFWREFNAARTLRELVPPFARWALARVLYEQARYDLWLALCGREKSYGPPAALAETLARRAPPPEGATPKRPQPINCTTDAEHRALRDTHDLLRAAFFSE